MQRDSHTRIPEIVPAGDSSIEGTAKWLNAGKRFGLITSGEGIVHRSALQADGYRSVQEGRRVESEAGRKAHVPQPQNNSANSDQPRAPATSGCCQAMIAGQPSSAVSAGADRSTDVIAVAASAP